MGRKTYEDRLWELQDDLLTVDKTENVPDEGEEEDWEESEDLSGEDYEDTPGGKRDLKTYSRRNGIKEFSFYDAEEDGDDEEDVDYIPDNRREVRKRRRKNFFLLLVMILEIFVIGLIVLRFALWLG